MDEEESESETIRGMFDFYDSENKGFIYRVWQSFLSLLKDVNQKRHDHAKGPTSSSRKRWNSVKN